jgi:AcrR family transcriptional regulator
MSTTTPDTHPTTGGDHAEDPRVGRTRAAIMEAAAELMTADGPTEITHVNVATAANVSRTTVYKHYPTRVDLLRATIEAMGKSVPDVTDVTGDLRTDLERFFADLVTDLLDDQRAPMIATMMERALHDATFSAVRDELIGDFEPAFGVLVERGIETGQLRDDVDVPLAMASIAGSFLFLRFMSPHGLDHGSAGRVLDEFVRANAPR